jgi:hypothetical protein
VAIGAVSGTTGQRQVGGFVAQMPPQTVTPTQSMLAGHRHISRQFDLPITAQVEPGDKLLEVVDRGAPPFISYDNPIDAARSAQSLAVISVVKKESAFSTTVVNEDWITTTLTAEIKSVLKDTTGQLVEGGLIEVRESGGEITLDGRRIIARFEGTRQTKIGGTYLAVLGYHDGRFLFNRYGSAEFDQGRVLPMRLDVPGSGQSPEWVIQQVRATERRKP